MAGIQHDTLSDIQEIRRLLDGYQEGFAFVKELIQNADDAEASEVRLSWNAGLPESSGHPLLQGPALLILNNGPFDQKNKEGLMRMGLGSKASESDRIGRFGLGMKAVFHVCEGFFFLEKSNNPDLREFFCPWHPDRQQHWNLDKEAVDWKCLYHEATKGADPSWDTWFAVWIPLRQKAHCEIIAAIRGGEDAFPGELKDACPNSLKQPFQEPAPRLLETLVFLRHVNRLSFHDGNESHKLVHDREQQSFSHGGHYYRHNSPSLSEVADHWRQKPAWPKIFELGERFSGEQVPDKAKWEASVAVSVNRDEFVSGRLRLFWCVFLPVGNTPCEDLPVPGLGVDLHVFLHGYFFLNDARTHVYGVEDGFQEADEHNERGIRVAWNRTLATSADGLLPLVIPALEDCFAKELFTPGQVQQIVHSLASSLWFASHRASVGLKLQFGRYLQKGKWSWCSLPEATRILILPAYEWIEGELEAISAGMLPSTGDFIFALEPSPTLSVKDIGVAWTAEELDAFCGLLVDQASVYDQSERLYLRNLMADPRMPVVQSTRWKSLAIYEVRSLGERLHHVVTATAIEELLSSGVGFRQCSQNLETSLARACPQMKAWVIPDEMPPGILLPALTAANAASLVLKESHLTIASDRLDLVKLLAATDSVVACASAIRYLLHGSFENSKDQKTELLFHGGDWQGPIAVLMEAIGRSWCWVDALFQAELSEHNMNAINVKACSAGVFRQMCCMDTVEAVTMLMDLHTHHDFLLRNLNDGPEDDAMLRRLPIHRVGTDIFKAVSDGLWLAPERIPIEHNLPLWNELRDEAQIVERHTDRFLSLRQERVFGDQILDRHGIMRLAAKYKQPSIFAKLILECLSGGTPTTEAAQALGESKWLPLRSSGACKPSQILWLKDAESALAKVVEQLPQTVDLFTRSDLALEWELDGEPIDWAQSGWSTMANPRSPLIPVRLSLVDQLKKEVKASPSLHLGIARTNAAEIRHWLQAFEGIEADLSPAVGLVRHLVPPAEQEDDQPSEWQMELSRLFFESWTGREESRYKSALEALRQQHENAGRQLKDIIEEVFDLYLAAAKDAGCWDRDYVRDSKFSLLNQEGKWVAIGKLVLQVPGIDRSFLVRETSAKALGLKQPPAAASLQGQEILGEATTNHQLMVLLESYADRLGEGLSKRHWGLFLALLGPNVRELAEEFLGASINVDSIRIDLAGPYRCPARIRLVCCHYSCEIISGETVILRALNGATVNAMRETQGASLLVPQASPHGGNIHFIASPSGESRLTVSFKLYDPAILSRFTKQELRECLERTIQIHQREVLAVDPVVIGRVGEIFDAIQRTDQLGLSMAQQELLGACRIQLTQLSFRAAPGSDLGEALRLLEDADRFKAQARNERQLKFGSWEQTEAESRKAEDKGIELLRQVLGGDTSLQDALANAMAERIEQEQYRADSIPFELFQNADDALLEYPSEVDTPPVFVAHFDENEIRFAHWGRPINQPIGASDELARQHKRDLVKMLILHGSDKFALDGTRPTGKFGLGFKSVFLVCDRPEILSANLSFQVLGSFYPQRLPDISRDELKRWGDELMPGQRNGTVIRLPLRDGTSPAMAQRFFGLAAYLPIFAKKVQEIRLPLQNRIHRWNPSPVFQGSDWKLIEGRIVVNGQANDVLQVVGARVSWLFGTNAKALAALKHLPCVWITAPTMESGDLGFAVNGPFEPNPGRTHLNDSSQFGIRKNNELFAEASHLLGQFLELSFATMQGMEAGVFWHSVWELFSRPSLADQFTDGRTQVLRSVWAEGSGYRRIVESFRVIPNGLPEGIRALTTLPAVRLQTSGFLESSQGLAFLWDALQWDEMANPSNELRLTADEIVSSRVASILHSRLRLDEPFKQLSFPSLLRRLGGKECHFPAILCGKVASHISARKLFPDERTSAAYDWQDTEKDELTAFLDSLCFLNSAGTWSTARSLLVAGAPGHEGLRAGFAPAGRLLHHEYTRAGDAVDFFRLCRREMTISSKELLEWLRESIDGMDAARRKKALLFLASEDPFVFEVAGGLTEAERDRLFQSGEIQSLSQEDQNRMRLAFQGARLQQAHKEGRLFDVSHYPTRAIDDEFQDDIEIQGVIIGIDQIREVWDEAKALELFTLSGPLRGLVAPAFTQDADLLEALRKPQSLEGKSTWYRLLCLGCTLGLPLGIRPIEAVQRLWNGNLGERFWEATIPSSLGDVSRESFTRQLDSFFEEIIHQLMRNEAAGEDAAFWRRVFYDFRKMHHFVFLNHLPETILEFADYQEADGHSLIGFLRSGQVPDSIRDPNLPRFRGVIGQSITAPLLFLMRELRRLGVLDQRFNAACYYMNSPARRVARQLLWIADSSSPGGVSALVSISEQVHQEMKLKAGDLDSFFDLPLQLFAHLNPR